MKSTGKKLTNELLIVVFIFQLSSPTATTTTLGYIEGLYKLNH